MNRTQSLLPVALAAALAVACSQPPDQAGRAPTPAPAGKRVTVPAAPKGTVKRPLQNWGRYWLT